MNRQDLLELLSELVLCQSPPGEEAEIDALLIRKFEEAGVEARQDEATNVLAHLPGVGPRIMVCAPRGLLPHRKY